MSDRPVILTGATGFLGSHLLRGLLARGIPVTVLKRTTSNTRRIADLLDQVTTFDVDATPLREACRHGAPTAVIHAATAYGRKGESAARIVEANVGFPLLLLEAAADANIGDFFNVDSFFNTRTELPEGLNYYALSKAHFREYAMLVAQSRAMRFVNVRIEHMYGPNDDGTKFVPSVLQALLSERPVLDLTPGEQRRDFIFIDDVVDAFLTLVEHRDGLPAPLAHVGVGTGESVTVREMVAMARHIAGSGTELCFGALPYRTDEIMDSTADTTVLRRLGWAPRVSLADGLRHTIDAARSGLRAPAASVAGESREGR